MIVGFRLPDRRAHDFEILCIESLDAISVVGMIRNGVVMAVVRCWEKRAMELDLNKTETV